MSRLQIIAIVLVAADALSNLGTSQIKPNRTTKKSADTLLPNVKDLLPSRSFSAVKSTVAALETRLAEEQAHSIKALGKLKAEYELKLMTKQKNKTHIMHGNARLISEINDVKKANEVLKRRATQLVTANELLKEQLETFKSNLSLAQEFIQEGLGASKTNVSEVKVLEELAELEAAALANSKKQSLLKVAGSSSGELSLLAVASDVHELSEDVTKAVQERSAEAIMESLATSFSELADEENRSRSVLRDVFEKKLAEVETKNDDLSKEGDLLNKTKNDAENVHGRLLVAVNHLSKIHDNLVARLTAVKAFAVSLGRQPSSAAGGDGQQEEHREARTTARATKKRSRASRTNRRGKTGNSTAKSNKTKQ